MHPLVKVTVNKDGIPTWLKVKQQWVCWVVGKEKSGGKFNKVPVNPESGVYVDGMLICT